MKYLSWMYSQVLKQLYLEYLADNTTATIGCECAVRFEENNLAWYIKNATEPLLLQVRRSGIVDIEECKDKTQYKREKRRS